MSISDEVARAMDVAATMTEEDQRVLRAVAASDDGRVTFEYGSALYETANRLEDRGLLRVWGAGHGKVTYRISDGGRAVLCLLECVP